MSLLAAHINEAGISVLDASRILYREPGFALLDDEQLSLGAAAYSQARIKPRRIHRHFWADLRTQAIADNRFEHLSAADLVSRQLEQIWGRVRGSGDRLAIAVPAYMTTDNLSLLLGIAAELQVPVAALVDAAVAATRREYRGAVPVHVDLSLHSALLTRIAQSGQAQADRSEIIEDSGVLALHDAWIRGIAEAFVQQSRFDPLHTAETEQALYDRLPGWLAVAATQDTVPLEVSYRGISHEAEIESLELVGAAAPIYHGIVSNVRALYRADETPALQLSDRAARMPGLADILQARVGGEVFLLEPGASARGLLARWRDDPAGRGAVNLVRHLPWDQAAVEVRARASAAGGGRPTHLLLEHTAYPIDDRPLTLGSQPANGERWVDLQQDMPGVSRRHCSLQLENGQCVLRDYSRYGTFLNGHRIDGSAILQVGDRIRIGTPGIELQLITAEGGDGA
jgi:hypothetical protein